MAACAARAERRSAGMNPILAREFGTARFLEPLIAALAASGGASGRKGRDERAYEPGELAEVGAVAARHGMEMLADGMPVDWVIHEYGDLCQAITQLAQRRKARIPTRDFEALNWCLDNAIAAAVSEYAHQHELLASRETSETLHECLGRLADELRIPLDRASKAAGAIRSADGSTDEAASLEQNLKALREVIDRSLAEIRLQSGMTACPESIALADLVDDLNSRARMEAAAAGCGLEILPVSGLLAVYADRSLLSSALQQLLRAAFKEAGSGGRVLLRVLASSSRVFVDIESPSASADGRAPDPRAGAGDQRSASRGEIDPVRTIARRGVEQAGGRLGVRELAGARRLSRVDLPRLRLPAASRPVQP